MYCMAVTLSNSDAIRTIKENIAPATMTWLAPLIHPQFHELAKSCSCFSTVTNKQTEHSICSNDWSKYVKGANFIHYDETTERRRIAKDSKITVSAEMNQDFFCLGKYYDLEVIAMYHLGRKFFSIWKRAFFGHQPVVHVSENISLFNPVVERNPEISLTFRYDE
eukprot:Platyproteum_vivax@DN14554_c0_g1_i1.p1